MSTDVREQVRQLAAAFDEFVDDVTVDEAIGRVEAKTSIDKPASRRSNPDDRKREPAWSRLGVAAAAVVLLTGLVAALAWVDRGDSEPASSTPPPTDLPSDSAPFGQFVWPAPPQGYATLNELITAFTTEVLDWTAFEIDGDIDDRLQPQSFTLRNDALDANVAAVAIPSPDGWGFVQLGSGMSASLDNRGEVVLDFSTTAAVTSSSVTVRLSDGTSVDTTATSGDVELPGIDLAQLVSALVIGIDTNGTAVMATGGQFSSEASLSPTTPATEIDVVSTTTVSDQAPTPTVGPLDYAGTDTALPLWPEVNASDPPATTTAYGMALCDSGYGTKVLRVDPVAGQSHAYSGTLCVFIALTDPRAEAVTTCATATDRFHYARCQRRIDQTDTEGPGTAVSTIATTEQQTAMAAFPTATAWDRPEVFNVDLSAAAAPDSSVDFRDDSVAVTLNTAAETTGVDTPGVCFVIDLPGATVDGCVGHGLLATGLAYGAFQDGDGPIEIVGIVPDEITAIEIDGTTTLTPINNVWHYTATDSTALRITVRSADGRTAATR